MNSSVGTSSPGPTSPAPAVPSYPGSGNLKATVSVIEDIKQERDERTYQKVYSKSRLLDKIKEYEAGKYSKLYIDTYLTYVHLEGIISNNDFLEIKGLLK